MMTLSPRDALRLVLDAAWRRRYLLVIPMLLMIPLAYAVSQLAPRSYAARSLMLLVDTTNNPFNKEILNSGSSLRMRTDGLKALLISDRVLDNVMRDVLGNDTPSDPRMQGLWKKGFAERLTLEPVGTDFLELQLKGNNPKGMGRQLEFVVSRFFDALLPGGASPSAAELLLGKRKEELDVAERTHREFKARFDASADAGRLQRLREAGAQQEMRRRELEQATAAIEQIRKALGADAPSALTLDTEVSRTRETVTAAGQSGVADAAARQRLEQLVALQAAQAARTQLQREIQAIAKSMEGLQRSQQNISEAENQLLALERDMKEARGLYESYVARYGGQVTNRSSGLAFAAPERIKLVDLPTDPTVPIGTLRTILLLGFVASGALGLGLALLAELFDPRVRSPQYVSTLTQLPVLARLP